MNSLVRRLDGYWLAPAPAERLALLRILIGGFALVYIAITAGNLMSVATFDARQFDPVGISNVLGGPLAASLACGLVVATFVAGLAFVAGWRFRFTGLLFALLLLWITSYRDSWGQIFHTENLLVLHILVLALTPAADVFSLDARKSRTAPVAADPRYGWPVRLLCLLTVITYVITAQAKLLDAGLEWITGDMLRNHVAYDNLRKIQLGDPHSPLGAALVPHAWIFYPLAVMSFIVELGAPVALWNRRLARLWVSSAVLFHVGIFALMAIIFPYQMLGFAYLPFFAVERWRAPARLELGRLQRRRRRTAPQW